ncbi:hypothetical protein C8A03DRAFT_31982, partial [Achaetomium macrosporum]
MDWAPVVEPFIEGLCLDDFEYDIPWPENSGPPTVLRYQGGNFDHFELQTDDDWKTWFESDVFKSDAPGNESSSGDQSSGFHVLLSPRVESLSIKMLSPAAEVPRPHYYLPFSLPRWAKITGAFRLHRAILYATKNNKTSYTFHRHAHGHRTNTLELHTAVAASYERPYSFSLSCTYFKNRKLSLAVLYSCDSNQVSRVAELLEASPEVASHPWLIAGVFAELQLNRMQALVDRVHLDSDPNNHQILLPLLDSLSKSQLWERYDVVLKVVTSAKETEEEVRTTRAQLKQIADKFAEEKRRWEEQLGSKNGAEQTDKQDDCLEDADRFINRFRDIDMELNCLMTQCRVAAEQQIQAGGMLQSELSRREAVAGRVQAKLGTFLAQIATFYLPVTSVATIFAVPAFKFENRWLDTNFRPVDDAPSSPSSSADSTKPVFSGYAIIYLLISVSMTAITMIAFFYAKRHATYDKDDDKAVRLAEEGQGRWISVSP